MPRVLGGLVAVMVLAVGFAGCAGRSRATVTPPARGVAVSPFEALPIPAYEGTGVADLKRLSLRAARDLAYAQALRFLAQDVVTLHVGRLSEVMGPGHETWVAPIGTSVSRALLMGKKFTEEIRVDNTLWVRVYMSKAEVDSLLLPILQQVAGELAPALREAFERDLRGATQVDEELRLLSAFQRRRTSGS
jgi:hypothetical protein